MAVKDLFSNQVKEFILYTTPDREIKVEILINDENLWLTQKNIADLFGVQRPAITKHLGNIFADGELEENMVSSILELTTSHGAMKDKVQIQKVKFYNLDAIIAVGYRVNSKKATQFRIWATQTLKEYILKGFVMDDNRLKNGQYFDKDYFVELLERVRSIRASERRVYQKITDIFAECSIDYDINSDITKNFYAMIQNKFHFAITGKTAAEIIYDKADKNKPFMGLTTWKHSPKCRIIKSDTFIAKNYLSEKEIKKLERAIVGYFDYIERMIEAETIFTMEYLSQSVNEFLSFNKYNIIEGNGKISHKKAIEKAESEYNEFNKYQNINSDFDKEIIKFLEDKK